MADDWLRFALHGDGQEGGRNNDNGDGSDHDMGLASCASPSSGGGRAEAAEAMEVDARHPLDEVLHVHRPLPERRWDVAEHEQRELQEPPAGYARAPLRRPFAALADVAQASAGAEHVARLGQMMLDHVFLDQMMLDQVLLIS